MATDGVVPDQISPPILSAVRTAAGDGGALWRDGGLSTFDLPGRGHAALRLGQDEALIVGRRPGAFAAVVSLEDVGRAPELLAPAGGCVFSGHAALSDDGVLVSGEYVAGSIAAMAVRRRRCDGAVEAVWPMPGIEPHDLAFARGGARLVAAIGGLVKDGGPKGPVFNPDGVDSAVLELDPLSGRVLRRFNLDPALASLSVRHLAVLPEGERVVFGMQDQDLDETRPLMGIVSLDEGAVDLLELPPREVCDFRGYIGSVAVDAGGHYIAASSPRAGAVGLWSARTGRWLGCVHAADVCGLAPGRRPGEFCASTGLGAVLMLEASAVGLSIVARWTLLVGFDNHMLVA